MAYQAYFPDMPFMLFHFVLEALILQNNTGWATV
jgi:hypothetical protein